MSTAITDANKPGLVAVRVTTFRGICVADLPMSQKWKRGYAWALFVRGQWPPKVWKVPPELEGRALVQMLEERCRMYRSQGQRKKKGKDTCE